MNTKDNKRHQETMQRAYATFAELLREQELNKLSVTALCEAANIDRSTFYANYIDIFDLADKTREKLRAVEQIIPNKKILKFLVWSLILRLKKPIENVARHALNILEFLNAQNIVIPSQSISNAEHKFFQYLFERSTDVAEILWNENNRNTSSISMYRTSALSLIIDRLGINKEKYKIFRGQ